MSVVDFTDSEDLEQELSILRKKLTTSQSSLYCWKCISLVVLSILLIVIAFDPVRKLNVSLPDFPQLPKINMKVEPTDTKVVDFHGPCLEDSYAFSWSLIDRKTGMEKHTCQKLAKKLRLRHPAQGGSYGNNEHKLWCLDITSLASAPASVILKVKFQSIDIEPYDWVREVRADTYLDLTLNKGQPIPKPYGIVFEKGTQNRWCLEFKSDESKSGSGFSVDVELQKLTGSWTKWNQCETEKITYKKAKMDGNCGIGVRNRTLKCTDETGCVEQTQVENCDTTPCETHDICKIDPTGVPCKDKHHYFDGIGRKDPEDPHVFLVLRSKKKSVNFNNVLMGVKDMMTKLEERHLDKRALTFGVSKYSDELMNTARRRLGLRLARSLLLGRVFTVGFTGSSNTAGHDNMFVSAYPLQVQSILRSLWRDIGLEGAAFQSIDHAIGGKLGTESQSWCVRSQIGDDVDVVFWESFMNDGGRPEESMLEIHLRNAVQLEKKPLWHTLQAGKCDRDRKPGDWRRDEGYNPIKNLASHYQKAGAANIHFHPCIGLEPLNDKKPYSEAYATWHPGSKGHRMYAEVIAYEYLSSLRQVLEELEDPIIEKAGHEITKDEKTVKALEELLKASPTDPLPQPKLCGDFCAKPSVCISGLRPLMPEYQLKRFVDPQTKWKYRVAANRHDVSGFDQMKGSQRPIDHKYAFVGRASTIDGWLKINISIPTKGLWIHAPYKDHTTEYKDDLCFEGETLRIKLDGTLYKCDSTGRKLKKMDVKGCYFENMPSGKHVLELAHDEKDKIFAVHHVVTW